MAKETKRKYIAVELFVGNTNTKYKGRLIGLIDEKEFSKIIGCPVLQTRIETSVSKPLAEIVDNFDDLENLRLVMSVRERNGLIAPKSLFITERLGYISAMTPDRSEISITGDNGWMMVSEGEE